MVVARREVWWAELARPPSPSAPLGAQPTLQEPTPFHGAGSWTNLAAPSPGFPHPLLVVQADAFNRSRLRTVLGVILTSNARLVDMPGNVLLPAKSTGLPRDSVANVTQIVTLDEGYLSRRVGQIPPRLMARVDNGLRRVLAL